MRITIGTAGRASRSVGSLRLGRLHEGVDVGSEIAQPRSGAPERALDRRHGHVEDRGRIRGGEREDLAQEQDGPLTRRQVLEGGDDRKSQLLPSWMGDARNHWYATAIAATHTRVGFRPEVRPHAFGRVLAPIMLRAGRRMARRLLEDLRIYLETGRPSPRKQRAVQRDTHALATTIDAAVG